MDWLYKITVTCFAASYLVVLALEVSRVFFKAKLRWYARIGFTLAGLFAHSVYLFYQGKLEIANNGIWLSNWTGWCYAAAWILVVVYLWVSIRKSKSVVGVFLVPLILLLIGLGILLVGQDPFTVSEAKTGWNMVHGISLLLGTVSVLLGFIFGLIYLIQAKRLKQKKDPWKLFRLPSLEWLHRCSERSLVVSTILMGAGLISGCAINLVQGSANQGPTIAWSNPVIWSSAILFVWLLIVSIINTLYRPLQQGRKIAYIMVCSFICLALEIALVLMLGHAAGQKSSGQLLDTLFARHAIVESAEPVEANQ